MDPTTSGGTLLRDLGDPYSSRLAVRIATWIGMIA